LNEKVTKIWRTSRRTIKIDRPLVMGILNLTPDSFSDGGRFVDVETAMGRSEQMIAEGADIIDIGGESTRPGSQRVSVQEETDRVIPVIEAVTAKFDIPISIDTSKAQVAKAAVDSGAEIINDISGLRFDEQIAEVAAETTAGLVLMHSRGEFEAMHSQTPVKDIFEEIVADFRRSLEMAIAAGVKADSVVLDVGIGFGKTAEQNLQLIADLQRIIKMYPDHPMLVGASRKSFVGKLLDIPDPEARLNGSLAMAAIAAWNGASILRVHDIHETVETLRIVAALGEARS
jgi:dihydropteroate synthase